MGETAREWYKFLYGLSIYTHIFIYNIYLFVYLRIDLLIYVYLCTFYVFNSYIYLYLYLEYITCMYTVFACLRLAMFVSVYVWMKMHVSKSVGRSAVTWSISGGQHFWVKWLSKSHLSSAHAGNSKIDNYLTAGDSNWGNLYLVSQMDLASFHVDLISPTIRKPFHPFHGLHHLRPGGGTKASRTGW